MIFYRVVLAALSKLASSRLRPPRNITPPQLDNNNDVQVDYPRYMSEASVSFVASLLRHEVSERLGTGPTGKEDIKSHSFMAGLVHLVHIRTRALTVPGRCRAFRRSFKTKPNRNGRQCQNENCSPWLSLQVNSPCLTQGRKSRL